MAGKLIADTLESAAGGRPAVTKGAFCLAWAKFAGATGVIDKAFNVSSITRNGAGDYTANFTNTLVDTGYVVVGSMGDLGAGNALASLQVSNVTPRTTSLFRFYSQLNGGTPGDYASTMFAVFGTN